ncbi:MAG TPA: acyltransferase [Streptosporangiaceae bacterium]|nr:acyltransferase [Streptosporangiaceae bacterium]
MSPRETPARRCARRAPRTLMRDAVAGFVHRGWQAVQAAALITAETAAGRRFARFGSGSSMAFPTGAVFGERWIEVGEDTIIGMHVTMCAGMVPGQDLGPQPVLRVGDRCAIGRGSHIVAHLSVQIGDDVFTGPYVYITDQNHGYADPYLPIGRQWPSNDTVSIGSGAWLGAGAIILPGAMIGRNVVVAAGSVVRGTVPDRCVVAGVPARVVREYVPGSGWKPPLRDDGTGPVHNDGTGPVHDDSTGPVHDDGTGPVP